MKIVDINSDEPLTKEERLAIYKGMRKDIIDNMDYYINEGYGFCKACARVTADNYCLSNDVLITSVYLSIYNYDNMLVVLPELAKHRPDGSPEYWFNHNKLEMELRIKILTEIISKMEESVKT